LKTPGLLLHEQQEVAAVDPPGIAGEDAGVALELLLPLRTPRRTPWPRKTPGLEGARELSTSGPKGPKSSPELGRTKAQTMGKKVREAPAAQVDFICVALGVRGVAEE